MTTVKNKIIVKPCESDNISDGGIIVPDSFKVRGCKAVIVAIGNKVNKMKVGNTVWHVKGAGEEVENNGEKYYVMQDRDVLSYSDN